MDVDYLYTQIVHEDNERDSAISFMRAVGPRTSTLEHEVPERLFSTDTDRVNGISAAKAISLAQSEGQRIFAITLENLDTALASVNADANLEREIRDAVYAGMEVGIHQDPIVYYGWRGHGYVIVDPETGAGACKISGGRDGAFVLLLTLLVSAIGGFFDGLSESLNTDNNGKLVNSWKDQEAAKKFSKMAGVLAVIGALLSIVFTLKDDSLSASDKVGQVSLTILGAALSSGLGASVGALVLNPVLAAVISLMFAAVITIALSIIAAEYFSEG